MKPLKDSNDPSTNGHGSAHKPGHPASSISSTGPIPDTGQVGNVIRPPSVGPDSPRRLDVAPDSLMAVLAGMVSVTTMTQLVEYQAISNAFMAETIERLNFAANGVDGCYRHATFTETVERFLAAEEAKENSPHTSAGNDDSTAADIEDDSQGTVAVAEGPVLPIFPRFRLENTFSGWVHSLAETEDISEFTTVLGTTSDLTYSKITTAMMLGHGLPRFTARVFAGEFTIDHVHAVTRSARDLAFEHFPGLDTYLAERRADVTIETFRKSVNTKVATLEPVEDRLEEASKRRRVSITTYPDGTAAVTLSGPAADLKAYILRLEAFARAIKAGQISEFTSDDTTGINVVDERSLDALMFDISTRTRPQLTIEVTTHDTTTGDTTTDEIPLDIPDDKATTAVGIVATANNEAETVRAAAAGAATDAGGVEVTTSLNLVLPTQGQWMAGQGKMLVTVPFLTLAGQSELPGVFSDGSPVPADAVRAIAGQCSTWTRILTDPATGTPIDAKATTYAIPTAVRRALVAKWQSCTTPGCTRRAETSEIDHLIPYDHENPGSGGLTTFRNTHPLCKAHHQAKTDRKYRVRMTGDGCVEYVFKHGVTTDVRPADQPINVEHARLFDQWIHPPDPDGGPSDPEGRPSDSDDEPPEPDDQPPDPDGGPPAGPPSSPGSGPRSPATDPAPPAGTGIPGGTDPLFDASVRPPRPPEPKVRPPNQRDRQGRQGRQGRQVEDTSAKAKKSRKRRGRRTAKGSANSTDPWSTDVRSFDSYWDRRDPPPF